MTTKTIKISESNYRSLCGFAGELQASFGEPVSVDRALTFFFQQTTLSDLAGTWKMNDREAEEMMSFLQKGWSRWKIKSV